jgi:hypothetical protein
VGLLSLTVLGGMLIGSQASADELPVFSRDLRPVVPIETAKAYTGEWTYTEEDSDRKRVRAVIKSTTRSLDRVSRDVARDSLREAFVPESGDVIRIDVYRDTLDLDMPKCEKLVNVPLEEWVDWRCEGRDLRVIHRLSDQALVQRVQGDDVDIYRRLQVKGRQMVMSIKLEHEMSPKPLYFSIRYAR